MNKKGYLLGLIFSLIIFIIIYALVGAKLLKEWATTAVVQNNLTGIEALLLNNLNIIVIIFMFIGMVIIAFTGGNN